MVMVLTTFSYPKASCNKVLWLILQIHPESNCLLPLPRLSCLPIPFVSTGLYQEPTPITISPLPFLPTLDSAVSTLPRKFSPLLNPMIGLHHFCSEIQIPGPGSKNCFINSASAHLSIVSFAHLHFFYCALNFMYSWGSWFNSDMGGL